MSIECIWSGVIGVLAGALLCSATAWPGRRFESFCWVFAGGALAVVAISMWMPA